ncbi:hypothetical protein BKA67DRAFT_536944 [Truncatella angustata]|uniref:FAD-binding domain-containing protein n=1 Tax=Truncatella angustata TaxID=152316 RepID=A0A9P8UIZ9_9PEZI|nr:uncharacterized protein BKA67DRAFT_536944 [Truncatella angustata]KAH6653258.1 hypothetical protein BKA67DRAFT_536944 [Truncatella angustata]
MYDDPLSTFTRGRVCLAGDAAHASAPHHGAGAGYGVEDALILAELLAAVSHRILPRPLSRIIPEVLTVYNEKRYDRCQALVESIRIVREMYEWQHASTRRDAEDFKKEFRSRCYKIWDFDVDEMVRGGLQALEKIFA